MVGMDMSLQNPFDRQPFLLGSDMEATYKEKGIAAKDSSTGEQKAMLISIVLANARALKLELGYPPVILLDEISAHLDIDRRGALYEEINALGAQAWMTGTDKNLFSEFGCKAKYFHVGMRAINRMAIVQWRKRDTCP